jgi:peptidoglycan/xylan/chitin deacetylase (PgdA/CDA1 family)
MRLFRPCLLSGLIYPEALFRVKTEEKILVLTFDDGPDPGSTPSILNILEKWQVKALFFCSGEASDKYPELIGEIKTRGHITGNHGYLHYDGWKTSVRNYCDNVEAAAKVTSDRYFRPPYGHLRLRQYLELRTRYRIIFWDIMSYDFDPEFGPYKSLNLLNKKIRPGSVIVLHDSPLSSCRYFLEDFIESSINKDFRFEVTI